MLKKNHLLFILLYLVLSQISATAMAKPLELVLVGPQQKITAGHDASADIYFHNLSSVPQPISEFNTLTFVLSGKQGKELVRAKAKGQESGQGNQVPASGFLKQTYTFVVPEHLEGQITLALKDRPTNTVAFNTVGAKDAPRKDMAEVSRMFQPFVEKISGHEPMYFLVGMDPGIEKTSFQLSFKYQFINEDGYLGQKAPWLSGLHLGYTQKSLWDLDSDSAPFEDTSYKPELFYLYGKTDMNDSWISALGIQFGYQHESNGRDGTDSRSTNHLYIKPIIGFHLWEGYHLKVAPKVWAYVNNDNDTNQDLYKYRGYFELETKIGSPEGVMLGSYFRNADKGSSYQLDLSYPLNKLFGGSLDMYIHAQYFNGYAETLLNYNDDYDALRLGISIVR